jgi:hypothetical protein
MERACDRPQYYVLPNFDHQTPSDIPGMGGGREAVFSKQEATKDV